MVHEQYRCRQGSGDLSVKLPTLATTDVNWLHFLVTKSSLVPVGSDSTLVHVMQNMYKDAIQVNPERFPYTMENCIIDEQNKARNSETRNTKIIRKLTILQVNLLLHCLQPQLQLTIFSSQTSSISLSLQRTFFLSQVVHATQLS